MVKNKLVYPLEEVLEKTKLKFLEGLSGEEYLVAEHKFKMWSMEMRLNLSNIRLTL